MALGGVVRVRHRSVAGAIFRRPLMRTSRALRQLPFVAEQVGEEVVAPPRRRRGPGDFQTTADRVTTMTFAKLILPPETLVLNVGAFWFVAHIVSGNAGTVRFAEGVTARNERNGLLVVHRHTGERLPDIACRGDGIRLSIGPFRVYLDQAHLDGSQRILKIAIASVALVRQPRALRSPINFLFGLPYVRPAAGKTKCLEAHRLERDVACENHQVGPGNLPPILLLDRPQQPARLVEVHIIRPAIERSEALLSGPGPATAVANAVSSRAVRSEE